MCPKPNDTGSALSKKSHVEDFPDSIPGLFNALTEKPDNLERWTSFTYPIDFDTTLFAPRKEMKLHFRKSIYFHFSNRNSYKQINLST